MAFEAMKAQIEQMFVQMETQPEDAHELLDRIHLELNQMKATGMPLPEDLAILEKKLDEEFARRGRMRGKAYR
jgi:hypothetical protein